MNKPKVAFICVHNSCRSQIAETLGRHLAADVFESYSAGTELKDHINPDAIRMMKKLHGIDMEKTQYNKLITDIPKPDIVIFMGCNVSCPFIGKEFDDNWKLEDPTGKSDEEFRKVINKGVDENILDLSKKVEKVNDVLELDIKDDSIGITLPKMNLDKEYEVESILRDGKTATKIKKNNSVIAMFNKSAKELGIEDYEKIEEVANILY